jgi:hypothetical protein
MATATFNTNIETPAPNAIANSYDLNTVITKDGFGDYISFVYRLGGQYTGVSLLNNILNIDENAYGEISVTVSAGDRDRPIKATASTKLYGFYATRLDIINNESTMIALETALASAKADWSSLVGDEKKR